MAMLALGAWTLAAPAWPPSSETSTDVATTAPLTPDQQTSCASGSAESHGCALPDVRAAGTAIDPPEVRGAHILEFTADECPVCRRMRPVVDRLVAACRELDTRIVRVDVATPQGRALADRHGVRGTPTFVLIDSTGAETSRLLGEQTQAEVAAAVEAAVGISCWG